MRRVFNLSTHTFAPTSTLADAASPFVQHLSGIGQRSCRTGPVVTFSARALSSSATTAESTTNTSSMSTTQPTAATTAAAKKPTPTSSSSALTPFRGSPDAFVSLVHSCPILVANFTARWCKPCTEVREDWEAMARYFTTTGHTTAVATSSCSSGGGKVSSSSDGAPRNKDENDNAAIGITFVDVDIQDNETLAAIHDVRCVPTYCCYVGGYRGKPQVSPAPSSSLVGATAKEEDGATAAAADGDTRRTATMSTADTNTTATTSTTSSGQDDPFPSLPEAPSSRGLFGTVEGAHLEKVHGMVEAALEAYRMAHCGHSK